MNHSYQLLMLIATPKLAEKASELFAEHKLPIQYRLSADGTASSEIMDTLGFGSVEKRVLIGMVPQSFGNEMLGLLHSRLRLDAVNSGIAFTLPLTGATRLLAAMMDSIGGNNDTSENGKDGTTMAEKKYSLIAAIIDRGFNAEVMDAAKSAGAGGGTILHSRSIETEEAAGFWGLSVQDEKEIVLILADHKHKVQIMSAISERCGMQTEAKGLVLSLPIDSVMGL